MDSLATTIFERFVKLGLVWEAWEEMTESAHGLACSLGSICVLLLLKDAV